MSKTIRAIASCRVSSSEQLENNSLNRQRTAVIAAAAELNVVIPDEYWWSGSVSSKSGTNVDRKDLKEMLSACAKDKSIKYLIVDEPDRFMRSIDEAAYFEVSFKRMGVKIWYASDPELNRSDLGSKLLKFTKYLSAEGSNEERQTKSISGQTKALLEGRYPFIPKLGYSRGYERGIHEINPKSGPMLQRLLSAVAAGTLTPSRALVELNSNEYMKNRATYKMDKFRRILTDPYYAGIVEINKQVKVRNTNGLHEPLITIMQHNQLLSVMNRRKKNQSGPRKDGNPKYPLSNLIACSNCVDRPNGRMVGFDHGNGRNPNLVYEKYRCRACKRYIKRDVLHDMVTNQFAGVKMTSSGKTELLGVLNVLWKQREDESLQEIQRLRHRISSISQSIAQQVEAATDPSNLIIKNEIIDSIRIKKADMADLEAKLLSIEEASKVDWAKFLDYAHNFIDNMGVKFLEISKENRLRCKQLVFPKGILLDSNSEVYIPEISSLYRLPSIKTDANASGQALMVRVRRL